MVKILEIGVICVSLFTAALLALQVAGTFKYGRSRLRSVPRADWRKGVIYAFGKGMMPWEKESARKHLLTYLAGFGYHFGIFSAFIYLYAAVFSIQVPPAAGMILKILTGAGLIFGLGLFIKRSAKNDMRRISSPDDFASNLLVDLFLLLALLNMFGVPARNLFYGESILLLLYIPVGKIRHCFFFFYSRIIFGRFYGRRGVFPHPRAEEENFS
jgi:hypothetical protein